MRKLLIPFLIGLFVASGAMAQTKSALTGAVVDQDNAPLPGVTVSLASDELIGGTQIKTTEGNGEFKFLLLPPGNYHVEATLDGFKLDHLVCGYDARHPIRVFDSRVYLTSDAVKIQAWVMHRLSHPVRSRDSDLSVVSNFRDFDALVGRAGSYPEEQRDQQQRDGSVTAHNSPPVHGGGTKNLTLQPAFRVRVAG